LVRLLLLISILGLCSGCSLFTEYVYVHDRFIVITKPEPPKLTVVSTEELAPLPDWVKAKILDNVVSLRTYIKQIDTAVDKYNVQAEDHNKNKETSP